MKNFYNFLLEMKMKINTKKINKNTKRIQQLRNEMIKNDTDILANCCQGMYEIGEPTTDEEREQLKEHIDMYNQTEAMLREHVEKFENYLRYY